MKSAIAGPLTVEQGCRTPFCVAVSAGLFAAGGIPTRGLTAAQQRGQQAARRVDQDDGGQFLVGFVFIRSQSWANQRSIALGSRSRAWRWGFCGRTPRSVSQALT